MSLLTAAKESVSSSVRTSIDRAKQVFAGIREQMSGILRTGIDQVDQGTFVRLLGAGVLGVLAAIPYQLSLIEQQQIDVPIPVIVIQALIANGIIV
jgi:hypothetical protein